MKEDILSRLSASYPWKERLHWFDSIGSTNDHLKALARQGAPHGTAVIAGHQTGGKGRMGRSFESPAGKGVYLSLLLRPNAAPEQLMHLTCAAAVAMCDALEASCGICPGIKWTNDLVIGKRKLGGILTELSVDPITQKVAWVVVGIGINCCQRKWQFPAEIRDMACSLDMDWQDVPWLAADLIRALHQMDQDLLAKKIEIMASFRQKCVTIGSEISVVRADLVRHGKALAVDDEGGLLVEYPDGTRETVTSGEVSIRGMYGYV